MQENEFEKQVKIKMDELSFSPSEPVWEAIKKQIEKKKRRILPFIFLLIVVAIAGSYFTYTNLNNSIKKQNKQYTILNKNNETHLSFQNQQKNNKQFLPSKSTSSFLNRDQQGYIKKQYHYSLENLPVSNLRNTYSLNQNKFSVTQNANRNYYKDDQNAISSQALIKNYRTTDTLINNRQVLNADSLKQNDNNLNFNGSNNKINNSDSSIASKKENTLIKKNDSITQTNSVKSTPKQTLKKNQLAKWQWGITGIYGRSNLVNNFNLGTLNSSQTNDYNADTIISRSNMSGKPYKPASAYSFGIILNRKIFKNAYISSGLKYVHLSTKSYTAISSNYSLVAAPAPFNFNPTNSNYISGSEKTYFNRYNFIELPVSFQNNLLHVKQFAVSYNVGVSVMQLITAKSLIYNSRENVFFKDTSNLRHTQIQLLSALNLRLNTKNSGSFLLGPHVEYSLSNFLKTNNFGKLHYIQFNLQATWLFNKK